MTDPIIYHGTPLTPRSALLDVLSGRAGCVSFFRPDDLDLVDAVCSRMMLDNGAFSFWMEAVRSGKEWDDKPRNWTPYYRWLEPRLNAVGRWAVIPDMPGAPSQLNDSLLADWPFGSKLGVPLWHMNGPLDRLARLCERFDMVALGWIGDPKKEPVGCERYQRRMEEVAKMFGNEWPKLHMMRGVKVAFDYPFKSADATSLAQNGHRYDSPIDTLCGDQWRGRRAYADKLERRRPEHHRLNGRYRTFECPTL